MRKSTIAAAILILIIAIASGLATYYGLKYLWTQENEGTGGGTTPGQDNGGTTPFFGSAPDVAVTLSIPDAYLGDYPQATFTVTNTGDPCTVSYTIFQTAPQTGSFSLEKGESKTVNITGPQVRDIGAWSTNVQVIASNSYGSDTAQASTSFNVDVMPFDATSYVDLNIVQQAIDEFTEIVQSLVLRLYDWVGHPAEGYKRFFVTPDFQTIQVITTHLTSRHPGDQELQAKEIYYWVRNWISYDMDEYWTLPGTDFKIVKNILDGSQVELPAETLYDRGGVCINYSLVLASMYKAAGFDVRLVTLQNDDGEGHAINMLYLPDATDVRHSPGYPGWVTLDATNNVIFGEIYEEWINSFQHVDIADV